MLMEKEVSKDYLNMDNDVRHKNSKVDYNIGRIKQDISQKNNNQYYLFSEDEVAYNIGKLNPTNKISEENIDIEFIIPTLIKYKDDKHDVLEIFHQIQTLVFHGKSLIEDYVKKMKATAESSLVEEYIINETDSKTVKTDSSLIKEELDMKGIKEEISKTNNGYCNSSQENGQTKLLPCNGCNKSFSKQSSFEIHMKSCIHLDSTKKELFNDNNDSTQIECKIKNHICKDCEKSFSRKSNLKKHVKIVHAEDRIEKLINKGKTIPCTECNKMFSKRISLWGHLRKCHGHKFVAEDKIKQLINKGKTIPCTECNKMFSKRNSLRIHLRNFHGQKFVAGGRLTDFEMKEIERTGIRSCSKCEKEFPFVTHLEKRRFLKHIKGMKSKSLDCAATLKQKLQKCNCDKTFKFASQKSRHIKLEHLGYISCPKCMKCFQDADSLEIHLRNHEKINNIEMVCEQCGKNLKRHRYRYHKRMHHSKLVSICDICQKTFATPYQLKCHKEINHQEATPYQCDICAKMFKSNGRLLKHTRGSHGERNIQCEKCEKRFIDESRLKIHNINAHLKTRPYACRYNCGGMAYNDSSNRNSHERKKHGSIFPTKPSLLSPTKTHGAT